MSHESLPVVDKGYTFSWSFQYLEPDETPVDCTGFELDVTITGMFPAGTLTFSSDGAATANGSSVAWTDEANGEFTVTLTDTETDLATKRGRFAIGLRDGVNNPLIWESDILLNDLS